MKKKYIIGVIGAGNMGSGIAQKYASEGFSVIIMDNNIDALNIGKKNIESTLNEAREKKIFNLNKILEIRKNLSFSSNKNDLKKTDLIIEAIFEDKKIKQKLFKELDEICDKKTIFATNTSNFLISELSNNIIKRTDKFIGLHYFHHPAKNKLVEIIRGPKTSQETYDFVLELQKKCLKIPIESKDNNGFIVNRFFIPWLNESMKIAEEKEVNIATIEAVARDIFSINIGPFQLMNIAGLSITYHATNNLSKSFGNFYDVSRLMIPLLEKNKKWNLSGNIDYKMTEYVSKRLLGVVFYLANEIVFIEEICSLNDCDLGARIGLRWPMGPFEMMNNIGIKKSNNLIENFKKQHNSINISSKKQVISKKFNIEFVKLKINKDTGIITLNREDNLNALTEGLINDLDITFTKLENNEKIKIIIITATGRSFAAGADINFFIKKIKNKEIGKIINFATKAQELFIKIKKSNKLIVCCMNGLALGGGLELALACDKIIANENVIMGFPETSIGIYPGLGGTQRTPRRIGIELARWLILTGNLISSKDANEIGLIDDCYSGYNVVDYTLELIKNDKLINNKKIINLSNKHIKIKDFFKSDLKELNKIQSNDILLKKLIKKLSQNAPIAKKIANKLIYLSENTTLEKGLCEEIKYLNNIFNTKDAIEGLLSVGKYRPNFIGK